MLGPLEIGLIALVILLLFGARKLPELGRGLGKGIRGFKEETRDLKRPAEDAPLLNPELRAEGEVIDVPSSELHAQQPRAQQGHAASHTERP